MPDRKWTLQAMVDSSGQMRMNAVGNLSPAEIVFALEYIKRSVLAGDMKPLQGGLVRPALDRPVTPRSV